MCISNILLKKTDILRQNNNNFLIYILTYFLFHTSLPHGFFFSKPISLKIHFNIFVGRKNPLIFITDNFKTESVTCISTKPHWLGEEK